MCKYTNDNSDENCNGCGCSNNCNCSDCGNMKQEGQVRRCNNNYCVDGCNHQVTNKNYCNNYYSRYNNYYVKECNYVKNYVRDYNICHYSTQTIDCGCEYLGATNIVANNCCCNSSCRC